MASSKAGKFRRILLGVGLAVSLSGCGEDVEPLGDGSLALSWQISPHGCESAGVEEVEVRLENAHRNYDERFACEAGQAELTQLAPANYKLSIVGIDVNGLATFGADTEKVEVRAEERVDAPHVRLSARPASLEVSWRFDNGKVCGANGVAEVEVALFDEAFYELDRQTFSCDAGVGQLEDIVAGEYLVEAVAESEDGGVYEGMSDVTLKRGDEAEIDVELTK
jgi:hypothetical protein